MDIRPPRKRSVPPPMEPVLPAPVESREPVHEMSDMKELLAKRQKARRRKIMLAVASVVLVLLASCFAWYMWALAPKDPTATQPLRFVVASGEGSAAIASSLEEHGLIRSAVAFQIHAEISGSKGKLQAGGFALSPSMSVPDITSHMVKGNTDELNVIILPGLTLQQQMDPGVKNSLAYQGFDEEELKAAFADFYDHPLLAGRPNEATLEGYIFPETYRINASDPLSVLLERSFDELYDRLQKDGMIAKFEAHGLSLYQAITLASIVQKEVSDEQDQRQVAQVFLKRLKENMPLGSDPTFIYAAEQLGVEPSINIDSPYNTRRFGGLPPGPIANMNYSALQAVANPAPGDYLYFVSGDGEDTGKTFFSRTEAEHEANVEAHCREICR